MSLGSPLKDKQLVWRSRFPSRTRGLVEVVSLAEEKCLQCLLEEDCVMAEEVLDAFYSSLGVERHM